MYDIVDVVAKTFTSILDWNVLILSLTRDPNERDTMQTNGRVVKRNYNAQISKLQQMFMVGF